MSACVWSWFCCSFALVFVWHRHMNWSITAFLKVVGGEAVSCTSEHAVAMFAQGTNRGVPVSQSVFV
jgi:hypothetical protein